MNVLISLYRGYGLGDAVQMSAVLRHVRKYRPHWIIDYQAEPGKESVGRGIAHNTLVYGDPYPSPHYDAEVQILLFDTWANWHDRPNTRVSSCLHERFGLGWDPECARYQINVRQQARILAHNLMVDVRNKARRSGTGIVALHYMGDSSPQRKNLSHAQALDIVRLIKDAGRIPLLLDPRDLSPVTETARIASTGKLAPSWWGGDAEMTAAIISHCNAFIGIDSGPGKCASATDTPTLIIWTGHHPAPFHDPAPNTTHLVPVGYHGLRPVCHDAGVISWFEAHHHVRTYDGNPVPEVAAWLKEVV